jgi:hypothetical protein
MKHKYISCDLMELLVVGSCTGEKNVRDCPYLLTEADFDEPSALLRREAELGRWALPAVRLYTGWQHRYMMMGINAIRERFGSPRVRTCARRAQVGFHDLVLNFEIPRKAVRIEVWRSPHEDREQNANVTRSRPRSSMNG